MAAEAWIPLESNPDLLNHYAKKLGMPAKWGFQDVVSLDEADLKALKSPHAFLLLYPHSDKTDAIEIGSAACASKQCGTCCNKIPFFIQQHTKNACGAVALFHALANNAHELNCAKDSPICKFMHETEKLSALERGHKMAAHAEFRALNDEAAKQGQTSAPDRNAELDLHFVAIVRSGKCVYVLDGRRDAPTCTCVTCKADGGCCTHDSVSDAELCHAAACIAKKLMEAAESERFSVLALTAA